MRTSLLLICCLISSQLALSQIHISATPTGKHQDLLQQAKRGKKFYDFVKQQRKDSVALIKADSSLTRKEKHAQIKAFKERFREERRQAKAYAKNRVAEKTGYTLPDTIPYPLKTPDDSLKWALQVLASEGQYEEIQKIYQAYLAIDTLSADSLGNVAAQRAEQITASFLPEELKSAQTLPLPRELSGDAGQLSMDDIPAAELPHERLDELLKEAPKGSIDEAVSSLGNLKSKYSKLPDMRYPEKGIKKNSLKGQGLKKRLVLGGNIAIPSTDPVMVDIDLQPGFKITKKWVVGGSIIWREAFAPGDSLSKVQVEHAHGYGAFTSYDVIGNFFLYSEYLGLKELALFAHEAENVPWNYEWLLGLGGKINLFQYVNLTMILAYDLNHQKNELHFRPIVLKVGYRIEQLPFLK